MDEFNIKRCEAALDWLHKFLTPATTPFKDFSNVPKEEREKGLEINFIPSSSNKIWDEYIQYLKDNNDQEKLKRVYAYLSLTGALGA